MTARTAEETVERGGGDRTAPDRPRGGAGAALAAVWLLVAVLAVRQIVAVFGKPPQDRLTDLLGWLGAGGVLRVPGGLYDAAHPFTGTPFAALLLRPLTGAAEPGLGVVWTCGTLLLVAAVGLVAVRALPGPLTRRTARFAPPVALCLLALSVPVRNTFSLGQTGVLTVLLVLCGWLTADRNQRISGVLIGVAAAFQPAVLLFVPLLWLTGRRPAALTAGGTFAATTLLAWLLLPRDSWAYWVHHLAGTGLGDPSDALANQSLHGALLRLGLRGPVELLVLAALVATVAWLALRRAVSYARDGQPLLAAAVTGCAVVAASPTAWQHQQLWILLAVVGRVGRRGGDRLVWPILVVLVMSLDGGALLPHMPFLSVLGDNLPLLTALLAACAVPFLARSSPVWDRPEPSGPLSRPTLMLELLLIRVGYFAYSYVRAHAPEARALAEGHGRAILDVEAALHLDMEYALNQLTARTPWLEAACNFYYSAFHFAVPLTLLAVLYLRRPAGYRVQRTALCLTTLLGLVGFWLYPLAPPRLMPALGFVDTAHGPQDLAHPDFGPLTGLSNQYAAMPSLHVGWSLWCAVALVGMTSRPWLRALGVAYPLVTTFVVMATANHYLLDAAGGALVVAGGYALQRTLWRLRGLGAPGGADPADPAESTPRGAAPVPYPPGRTAPTVPAPAGPAGPPAATVPEDGRPGQGAGRGPSGGG